MSFLEPTGRACIEKSEEIDERSFFYGDMSARGPSAAGKSPVVCPSFGPGMAWHVFLEPTGRACIEKFEEMDKKYFTLIQRADRVEK
jgi:hypothetical protein